ncbi:MAG TPA: AAA family ATPase, partial [Stellaceae bacterium]|nr:AAA family ATPase [Stellaceae bacterium]
AATPDDLLSTYQDYAIRLYAIAEVEGRATGEASEILEEFALRHRIADHAGGQDALQHILSEAVRGRRALYKPTANGHRGARAQIDGELSTICVADVEARPIEWLWSGRIARGKLTLLAGNPDLGKSQIAIDVSARLSCGAGWPDGGTATACSTLMLSAEDAVEDTIRPRFEAAKADLKRIHVVTMVIEKNGARRSFNLQEDIDRLREKISAIGDVALVVIDPITSYMGAKIDSHRTTDVRGVLEPFAALADETKVAVLGITHPPKAAQSNALHAFTGSLAYVAAARLAFLAIEEADTDRRLLLPVKNNIGARAPGLGYRLEQTIVSNGIVASRVCWDSGPVTTTANEAMRMTSSEDRAARADAKELLREQLADGPKAATDIESAAKDLGISDRTLRRARKDLGVISKKDGYAGGWSWSLPEGGQDGQP